MSSTSLQYTARGYKRQMAPSWALPRPVRSSSLTLRVLMDIFLSFPPIRVLRLPLSDPQRGPSEMRAGGTYLPSPELLRTMDYTHTSQTCGLFLGKCK